LLHDKEWQFPEAAEERKGNPEMKCEGGKIKVVNVV